MLFLYQQNFVKKLSLLKCFLSTGTEGLYLYNFQHLMINLPIISLMKQLHMRLYLNHCSASIFNDSISKLFVLILLFVVIITHSFWAFKSYFHMIHHHRNTCIWIFHSSHKVNMLFAVFTYWIFRFIWFIHFLSFEIFGNN